MPLHPSTQQQAPIAQPPTSNDSPLTRTVDASRNPLPFSFRRPFQPNVSSTSLVSSTAEGRPIPVDDTTVEHRTSALRELNHNYPSRPRYAESTGAQSSTYSEPVIVRSYYSPLPSRTVSSTRGGVLAQGGVFGGPATSQSPSTVSRLLPFASKMNSVGNGVMSTVARARNRKGPGTDAADQARLPPVDAFTFKSFLANMEGQENGDDVSADLDRIAEICARSRYSLSNQYEVHYAPHGSGTSFLTPASSNDETHGPTLQVVSSDDETSLTRHKKRRGGMRRRSQAIGTLETIMSSSRSSDEDSSKNKSAAEIAEEVRGRASWKTVDGSIPSSSPGDSPIANVSPTSLDDESHTKANTGKRAASLALIEVKRQNSRPVDRTAHRISTPGLLSEPAGPQASSSHLVIRTRLEEPLQAQPATPMLPAQGELEQHMAKGLVSATDQPVVERSLLLSVSAWMGWKSPSTIPEAQRGRAEGTLRELLRATNVNESQARRAG
ncbi:hypothetical protein S40293_00783 [Stachybotrys chartarum IBT 40293]|nr:hypothetical protein S40293_00783 [Stachybotrys chartarum IBT 40293]